MSTIEAERVRGAEQRRWPRAQVRLPVRLVDTEGRRVAGGGAVDDG